MNEQKFIYLFTIIGACLLFVDEKYSFVDHVWKIFILIQIFVLNVYQLSKINKEEKAIEKNNKK
ncbi:hypothetical protein ACFQ1J_05540 [Pedobacter boryungensis]